MNIPKKLLLPLSIIIIVEGILLHIGNYANNFAQLILSAIILSAIASGIGKLNIETYHWLLGAFIYFVMWAVFVFNPQYDSQLAPMFALSFAVILFIVQTLTCIIVQALSYAVGKLIKRAVLRRKIMLKQISIFVENKAGRLCAIMETLKGAEVNIRAMTIADTAEFGIVRLIVNDAGKAANALRDGNFTAKITEVVAFTIPDKFGALYDVVKLLGDGGINIEYSYSLMGMAENKAAIVIKVDNAVKAAEILKNLGVKLITLEDII